MIKLRTLLLKAETQYKLGSRWCSSFSTGFNPKTDYYNILGLAKGASDEDIRNGFRVKVKEFHPDINPNYQDKFKLINQAYTVLTNQNLKRQYLKMREAFQRQEQNTKGQKRINENPQSDVFQQAIKNSWKYINVKNKQKINTHIYRHGVNKSEEQQQQQKQKQQKRQKFNEKLPKLLFGFSGLLTTFIILEMILKYNVKKKYPNLI